MEVEAFREQVLRQVFGPEREEVSEEWKKLHSEELHDLHFCPRIIRELTRKKIKWGGERVTYGREGKHEVDFS